MTATSAAPKPMHSLDIRVYYEDTDAAGIVYYPNYLRFAERGRTEFLRAIGYDHVRLAREEGLHFVVRRCEIDYLAPARLDDLVRVDTAILAMGGATLDMDQTISRGGAVLVKARVRLACMGVEGRPRRFPAALRARFEELETREEAD